jgi:hypothetical protein
MESELAEARAAVDGERRRCADERAAFRAFRRRLAGQRFGGESGARGDGRPVTPGVRTVDGAREKADASVRRMRETYRETVMAVPHYDEEYGETLAENLAAEFGPDLAAAVAGAATLTPGLREALVATADAACNERDELVALLDRELASVSTATEKLGGVRCRLAAFEPRALVAAGFDDLRERYDEAGKLRRHVDDLAADRQATLADHRRTFAGADETVSVVEFLYADTDRTYPVLSAVAVTREQVDAAERRVLRSLARRV